MLIFGNTFTLNVITRPGEDSYSLESSETLLDEENEEISRSADPTENHEFDASSFNTYFGLLSPYPLISICCYTSTRRGILLEESNPSHVILYDAEPGFVRELEVSGRSICICFYNYLSKCLQFIFAFRDSS